MNIDWNAKGYQKDFAFVPKYGEAVLDLIDAAPGALAVDLGCGNGGLTGKLIERGYRVVGVDASAPMLALAKERYPDTTFLQADACTFQLPEQADVIFSNAVLHWIDAAKQNELIANIASQLKPGGQLVCEFGGKGCAETVHAALEKIFAAHGLTYRRTFYFPTVGEYAPMLERHGLQVRAALLFDRPTPQQTEDGLADWIRMFDKAPFAGVSEELQETIIREAYDIRIMSAELILYCYYLIVNTVLESDKIFLPGKAIAFFQNVFLILAAVFFYSRFGMNGMLYAFILSGIAECILVTAATRKKLNLLLERLTIRSK